MTNRRDREHDRAVRQYKREHPDITLDQARAAVAARSGQQHLPARIPAAPLPHPGERLEDYIQRVAAAAGVQRHRAMELLGLEPGTSATERLDHLTRSQLPDHAVRAIVAATGMTTDQALALTPPHTARPAPAAVRRTTEENLLSGRLRRGGEGKTRTDAGDLDRILAETNGQHALSFDLPVNDLRQTPYTPVFVDLDWPADAARPPVDPEVFDEVAKALGIGQHTNAPRHK